MTRVLVVDDEQAMADVIAEGLAAQRLDVVTVTSADRAFSMLADGDDFDVVVTDLNMRGMSGVDLCERVVRNRPDVPGRRGDGVRVAWRPRSRRCARGRSTSSPSRSRWRQLAIAVERAAQHRRLREEVKRLRQARRGVQDLRGARRRQRRR